MAHKWHCLILAGILLSPSAALADEKYGEKQRQERSGQYRERDSDRIYPGTFGNDKEWRKDQKERDKDRRKAFKDFQKDQRKAEKEREKNRREAYRDNDKDRREADKDERQGNKQRFPR